MAGSRTRDRERHERDILAAAERVFAVRGFEGATMAEVAAEAGYSVGTLYNLLDSKEAILERLLLRHLEALGREITAATAAARGPRAKLEAGVLARVRYFSRNAHFFRLYATEVPGGTSGPGGGPGVAAAIERLLGAVRDLFRELGHPRGEAATRALLFYAATRAWIVERVLKSRRRPTEREARRVAAALLDGLG